ncbi:hypothetical protein M3A74_00565 [Corynebacterium appendicis]|uniref:hypothetical protein n=1 Tax=Corynebacterium appendicis TaxID=163202 RepID=UPI00223A7185|nr:hypothetical protein [Corynebacterium appendicis]MCT1683313.1 hypothetical protein [Corynebacterium appendicis]
MKAGSLALAAALSLAAIVLAFVDLPRWIAFLLVVAAGVFLFIGLREKYREYNARESAPIELDPEQRETVARLKAEGRGDSAVRQVQLWFRNAGYEEAAAVVRGVD